MKDHIWVTLTAGNVYLDVTMTAVIPVSCFGNVCKHNLDHAYLTHGHILIDYDSSSESHIWHPLIDLSYDGDDDDVHPLRR
jgi:hypothetical protein